MSSLRVLALAACAPLFAGLLSAQTTPPPDCFLGLGTANVGAPYFCDYGSILNQYFTPYIQDTGISILLTFNVTAGTSLPPGLSLTPSGVLSGTPTTNGTFNYSIDVNFTITVSGQTVQETVPLEGQLQVGGSATGTTLVYPGGLVFSLIQAAAPSPQSVVLFSRRSTPMTYTASATTGSGGNWLSVSSSGSINPFQSATISVTADPTGLQAGTYSGTISLALSSGENFTLPVVLTVTSRQSLILSQSGFSFQAVQGGSSPASQTESVLNGGSGTLNFAAAASVTGGGNWLSVTPGSGAASSTSSLPVTVSVNSTGLAPGTYYGQLQFSVAGVANSTQTATVVLNIASPAQSPGPSLSVTGLVMVQAGGTLKTTTQLSISNPSPNPLNYSGSVSADSGSTFFTATPASGTLTSGQPAAISIQPNSGLAGGVYTGNLTLVFADPATQNIYQRRVEVVLIVVSSGGASIRDGVFLPHAACAPSKLILVSTQLGNSFAVPAAWPEPFEVTTVDDCGTFMTQGSVVSTFSNGDPPLVMASLQDGRWSGTWVPRGTSSSQVTITVQAHETQPPLLQGTTQLGGTVQTNPQVPVINAGGVVSAASNAPRQPLAPGSYFAVYGQNLNLGSVIAPSLPLQTQLGGTQALLGGRNLPLFYAGAGQVNALVPFDMPVNSTQQLIVQQGSQLSAPEPVVVSPAQPAIFTQDLSGAGYGVIVGYKADGSANFLVDASHAVSAGDVLVIYCTGLGPVDQAATAGNAGPSSPLANVLNPVTATIGGQPATVQFAGLAPTLTVYQVNLVVPSGVTPGKNVPLVLTQAGQQSSPVTINVQ